MTKFNFEKNLSHQSRAVEAVLSVFQDLDFVDKKDFESKFKNPKIKKDIFTYEENIKRVQRENSIKIDVDEKSNILDIAMETGTGKTYTYTKTIFELNKNFGIFKFIIAVPSLAIKAGTVNFLKSKGAIEHFKTQYDGKMINLHIVESKKGVKNKKSSMPTSISSFIESQKINNGKKIEVLLINSGMINSDTMQKKFDKSFFDKYETAMDGISATNSFMIIDEPHKFKKGAKTWKNIEKMNPQFILRYGATFPEVDKKVKNFLTGKNEKIKAKDYHNLIYNLTAVDSFNDNLVKGIIGFVDKFEEGKNVLLRFVSSDGEEATFELTEKEKNKKEEKKKFKLGKKDSFEKVHREMTDLFIENLNKSTVVLSNGLELKKGDKINPFSYSETLQEQMIKKAVQKHFELEKKYLTRETRIKPLTLFFIDNIEEYRRENGKIKLSLEGIIKSEIKKLLKNEKDSYYKKFLEESLKDVSKTHGGYFAKDKKETDEIIEKQINEILHNKEAILDLDNPRRFIFSKWTLREGWDNPNVFQICKLRSSGSEISKLQEVGRGLRLPVNEYGNREKNEQFFLNYFVDFTEDDFIEKLTKEINEKSEVVEFEENPEKLSEEMVKQIVEKYNLNENELLQELIVDKKVIDFSKKFLDKGYEYIKKTYPLIFISTGVNNGKIKIAGEKKKEKIKIRTKKYSKLKELWEKINQKVILEYKIKNEDKFLELLVNFLNDTKLNENSFTYVEKKVLIKDGEAKIKEKTLDSDNYDISLIKYSDFLYKLSQELKINFETLDKAFTESRIEINNFLSEKNIRKIKEEFNSYLLKETFTEFEIGYKEIKSNIHPTKFTDKDANILKEVNASDIGILSGDEEVADNYFLERLFFDSGLEKINILEDIESVEVFTKIPKNSIKIPIIGGKTYSPDFAYVVDYKDGTDKLFFVIETKNTTKKELREEEKKKIKYAEKFFKDKFKITFKEQYIDDKIVDLIQKRK